MFIGEKRECRTESHRVAQFEAVGLSSRRPLPMAPAGYKFSAGRCLDVGDEALDIAPLVPKVACDDLDLWILDEPEQHHLGELCGVCHSDDTSRNSLVIRMFCKVSTYPPPSLHPTFLNAPPSCLCSRGSKGAANILDSFSFFFS